MAIISIQKTVRMRLIENVNKPQGPSAALANAGATDTKDKRDVAFWHLRRLRLSKAYCGATAEDATF